MMLTSHELARIFFAGESDEARIVADAFDGRRVDRHRRVRWRA